MARIADPEAAKLGGNGLAASEKPGPLFLQGTGIHDSARRFRAGDDFIQGGYCQRPGGEANPQGRPERGSVYRSMTPGPLADIAKDDGQGMQTTLLICYRLAPAVHSRDRRHCGFSEICWPPDANLSHETPSQ